MTATATQASAAASASTGNGLRSRVAACAEITLLWDIAQAPKCWQTDHRKLFHADAKLEHGAARTAERSNSTGQWCGKWQAGSTKMFFLKNGLLKKNSLQNALQKLYGFHMPAQTDWGKESEWTAIRKPFGIVRLNDRICCGGKVSLG